MMCNFPLCRHNVDEGSDFCIHHRKHFGQPKEKKKQNRIKPVSDKLKKRLREDYSPKAKEFLKKNNRCQVQGCTHKSDHVHHKAGRIGDNLTNIDGWLAVCAFHHHKIEMEPTWAKENGYSVNRLQ